MAATYTNDKVSNNSSDPQIAKAGDVSVALDEKRRAALAEVDTAKFSYVQIHLRSWLCVSLRACTNLQPTATST